MKLPEWLTSGLSIVAIALSLAAIIISSPRTNLGFDYIGVIIGILSLLVTVLIGWNIFYALNMKSELNSKVDKLENELRKHSILNQKEFQNISETLLRANAFGNKLDNTLLEIMKSNEHKKGNQK